MNAPTAAPPRQSKMSLAAVTKGKQQAPVRVVCYGMEGVGKSTFAAGAPTPIFLGAESGTAQLDVARLPQPESFEDALDAVRLLEREAHEYGTLVVDTLDWLEPLIWAHVCREHNERDIEAFGYSKGYVAALDSWRVFLAALERLRAAKRMHVILLAHAWIKPFKNPLGDDYDRIELKLHAKASGLVKEWSDAVLFAQFEQFAHKDEKTKRVRGVSTGARVLLTQRTAAYDAKNRYSLPGELPLSWGDFWTAVQAGQVASPAVLKKAIAEVAAQLGGELGPKVLETMTKAGEDAQSLALVLNRAQVRLNEKELSK